MPTNQTASQHQAIDRAAGAQAPLGEGDRAYMPLFPGGNYYGDPRRPRITKRRMYAIYIVLLVVTAAFGVFAVVQWERGRHAMKQAALLADQNASLTTRINDLESLGEGLADLVALAYDDPQNLLARLDELEDKRPAAAGTEIFTKLWVGAKDRETQDQGQDQVPDQTPDQTQVQTQVQASGDVTFETASGPAIIPAVPQIDLKAEPALQDVAKGDLVTPEPVASDAAKPEPATDAQRAAIEPSEADIAIAAKQESWIQIVDAAGTPIFTRLMKPGDQHKVRSGAAALLITGNPTGLTLSVDGVAAPAFNPKGPTRREIALDPARLMDGTAEQPAKRAPPNAQP